MSMTKDEWGKLVSIETSTDYIKENMVTKDCVDNKIHDAFQEHIKAMHKSPTWAMIGKLFLYLSPAVAALYLTFH